MDKSASTIPPVAALSAVPLVMPEPMVAPSPVSAAQAADHQRFLISDLCALLETYLEPEQVQEVYRAYLFGAEAHSGQHRMSGEPYIYHPLAVASILAEMRMDYHSIMAALLHDVIEDTGTAKDQLASASATRSPNSSTASAS